MLLKVENNFTESYFKLQNKQKDYNIFEQKNISVFIYGYPIDFKSKAWVTSEIIYNYYQKDNWDFVANIDGVYSIIILDKEKKKVFLITDRIGIYTLFYYQNQQHILISDSIKELKSLIPPVNLNMTSVIEFLNLGFKIGNKTLFDDIFEFEPALIYTIDKDLTKTEKKYWSVFEKDHKEKITKEEFREIFNSNLRTVAELDENVILPISGGRDTRSILSAITDYKSKLHCYTFGTEHHSDLDESKKICNHLKIDHNLVILGEDWAKRIDFNRSLKEMNCNGIGPFFFNLNVKESMERMQYPNSVALQGELGNQLWRHHPFGRNMPNSMDLESNALFMIKNITRVLYFKLDMTSFYSNLYRDRKIQDIVNLLHSSIKADLRKLENPEIPSDFSEFFILRTLCYNLYSNILKYIGKQNKLFLPFLQKDLLQQLHFLSIGERVDADYQNYIIKKNNEYLANLPYKNSGRSLKYIKLLSNMLSERLINRSYFRHPELHNYPKWLPRYHKEYIYDLLNYDKMVLAPLFNKEELEKQLNIFIYKQYSIKSKSDILFKFSNQHFIYNLFSLEQWLQSLKK